MKKSLYKVPNGKLLKIFLEDENSKIAFIKITGDFFAHPEENIEKLETHLRGCALSKDGLTEAIRVFLSRNPTAFFGLDADSLILTILNAS